MFKFIREEISAIKDRDPAARNTFEILFLYSGFHAVFWHRLSHWLYNKKRYTLARYVSQTIRFFTGIEIHPGAKIGKGLFIDHGMGVIIGETAEIGDNCTIYQGVTLGGTGKDVGKRHPTLGNNVLVGAGAKVLGPFKVGDNSKIAANAVVLSEVPENSTCVGVPARIVKINNRRVSNFDNVHMPDPVSQELCRLSAQLEKLEKMISKDNNE
ncbi:MAG: serine O-acetyltransferase [Ruminococcaceae bacterium]|nr:serine O-acetyltransferase [Oscillospiraceae bacterium]